MKTINRNFLLLIVTLLISVYGWSNDLPVLPYPQQVVLSSSPASFSSRLLIKFNGPDAAASMRLKGVWETFAAAQPDQGSAQAITVGLVSNTNIKNLLSSEGVGSLDKIGNEGYVLVINSKHRFIAANTETGLFYGMQTLKQLTRAGWNKSLTIVDWPSYEHRVIYDDISRGPIPTVGLQIPCTHLPTVVVAA